MKSRHSCGARPLKRFLIPLLVTAVIILLLFTQISLKDLWNLLRNAEPLWVLSGVGGYLAAILSRAFRYQWLIHSRHVSVRDLFRISTLYHLSLMVLPSKLGELSYPYFLNRVSGMPMTEGLASLIASRIYDFFTILILFAVAALGFQSLMKLSPYWIVFLSAFSIALILLSFFYMGHLLSLFSRLVGRVSMLLGRGAAERARWIQLKIHTMAEDFYAIQAKRSFLPVTLTTLASWILSYWMFYAFIKSFGISVTFMEVVFGSTIAIVANILPISGIGNWGILEAGWAAGFLLVGLSKVDAIATGFGVHLLLFITSGITSFFSWITLKKHQSPSHSTSPGK